jgi:DNA-binding NtrC family response regulator
MREKILIVDDELEMLHFLSRFFNRKGYEVHTAEGGAEAWKSIEETMYDLVICDLVMDDVSGTELLERVRATDNSLPFIIVTGAGTIETAVEAIKLGAYHYLTKPFQALQNSGCGDPGEAGPGVWETSPQDEYPARAG